MAPLVAPSSWKSLATLHSVTSLSVWIRVQPWDWTLFKTRYCVDEKRTVEGWGVVRSGRSSHFDQYFCHFFFLLQEAAWSLRKAALLPLQFLVIVKMEFTSMFVPRAPALEEGAVASQNQSAQNLVAEQLLWDQRCYAIGTTYRPMSLHSSEGVPLGVCISGRASRRG